MNILDNVPDWVIIWAFLLALLLMGFLPSETINYSIGY